MVASDEGGRGLGVGSEEGTSSNFCISLMKSNEYIRSKMRMFEFAVSIHKCLLCYSLDFSSFEKISLNGAYTKKRNLIDCTAP